ncbi:helix-turn-helix domain-containing protein [Micromonospora sp. NPDC004704]
MSNRPLAGQLGHLLRTEREAAGLTQARLAVRAGVSQQSLSRFESGRLAPTTTVVERLFDALGKQLRLEVEERDADLDAAIDAISEYEGIESDHVEMCLDDLNMMHRRAPDGLVYLIDGRLAAVLQGVPIRPTRVEVAIAEDDLPRLDDWIYAIPNCRRWVERWRDFSGYDISPLRPGPLRWASTSGELCVRLLPRLPDAVPIRSRDRELAVRPLVEVERDDPQIARIAARVRARTASR